MIEKRIIKDDQIPEEYRIVVVSDIHSHLNLFHQLMDHISLKADDYLIVLGDIIEKGPACYKSIQLIKILTRRKHTYCLMGNCEMALLELLENDERHEQLKSYMMNSPWNSLLKEACERFDIDYPSMDSQELQLKLRHVLKDEIALLHQLPTALEFDKFIFAHAGIEKRQDWENSSLYAFLEQQYFQDQGHDIEDKYVICGHLPVCNYSDTKIDNSIIINHRKRIISIDGGIGVKDIAQLNALVIHREDEGYMYMPYGLDEFKKVEVVHHNYPKFDSTVKVAWPNTEIEVLSVGTSFSWCKKLATSELCFIKNEFIYSKDSRYYCKDDYISSMIEVQEGDKVSLIGTYGKYAYVMRNGIVGWIRKDRLNIQ